MFPGLGGVQALEPSRNKQKLSVEALRRLRLSAEYRGWPPVKIGVDMVIRELGSIRDAADAVSVKKGRIERGVIAVHKGRDIGIEGRPHRLPRVLRTSLAEFLESKISTGVSFKDSDISAEVSMHCLCSFHILQAERLANTYRIKQPDDGTFDRAWVKRFTREEVSEGKWKPSREASPV